MQNRNEPIDRLPPHSPEAEEGFLAACLGGGQDGLTEGIEKVGLDVAVFYVSRHQMLWGVLLGMNQAGIPVEITAICERLTRVGQLEELGGLPYLVGLFRDSMPGLIAHFGSILVEKKTLRDLLRESQKAVSKCYLPEANGVDLVNQVTNALFQLADSGATRTRTIAESIAAVTDRIDSMDPAKPAMLGPSTGFHFLDQILCGFQPAQYIVLAARPGQGKSLLAMQWAEYWTMDLGLPVGIFSLEMSQDALVERLIFTRSRVPYQLYRSGFLATQNDPLIRKTCAELSGAASRNLLHVDDTVGMSIETLSMKMRRWHQRFGCRLFIIDYIQLLGGYAAKRGGHQNRVHELGDVSQALMALKKELNVPIIVLTQMNRNIEGNDQRNRLPVLADLKDSGQIEQDADVVMFIHDPAMKAAHHDPESPDGKKQLRFLHSETGQSLDRNWRLTKAEAFARQEMMRKNGESEEKIKKVKAWAGFIKRQDLLVVKQRNGPSGVHCELVRVKKWLRYLDAHTPVPRARTFAQAAQELLEDEEE